MSNQAIEMAFYLLARVALLGSFYYLGYAHGWNSCLRKCDSLAMKPLLKKYKELLRCYALAYDILEEHGLLDEEECDEE